MKGRIIVGALVLSAALAGQGFGFELLNDLLGINHGSNACCEPQCCEQACQPNCCTKSCGPVCGPKTCTPATCAPCGPKDCCEPNCCDPCCKPRCDLFAGLKGLFACKKCCCQPNCCEPCCKGCCENVKCCTPEPKCCEQNCCPKNCCEPCCKSNCCEPNCCEPNCCEPCCCKPRCTPIRDLIDDICSLRVSIYCVKKCGSCCATDCCESGCCEPGCCGGGAPMTAPSGTAPAKELPKAPPVDASASLRTNKYYKISRSVVRN